MKTKHYYFIFSFLLFLNVNVDGQIHSGVPLTFQRVIQAAPGLLLRDIDQTADGGYIITGSTGTFDSPDDVSLVKIDSAGTVLWTKTYGGNLEDEGWTVQQTFDGGYIIAGITFSFGLNGNAYLIRTNSAGDTLWTKAYLNTNQINGYSARQTNDSGFIITGGTNEAGGFSRVSLIKTNANGDTMWTKKYGGTGSDFGNCVRQTSDSGYLVVGVTTSFGVNGNAIYVIKTKANGDTLWTRVLGGNVDDEGWGVQETLDSAYIISGVTSSYGVGSSDAYLLKISSAGDVLWIKTYGGFDIDEAFSVQQTADNGYFICGLTNSFGAGDFDAYIVKTNSTGDTLWTKAYGGPGYDNGFSGRQTRDGGYILAGTTDGFVSSQVPDGIYIVKTDANGNSNCNESTTQTVVTSPVMTIIRPNTTVASGGTARSVATIVGSAGNDSTLCALTTSMDQFSNDKSISLYPNPATNELTIRNAELKMTNSTVYIINMLGQTVFCSPLLGRAAGGEVSQSAIDVSSLPSGLYFIRVADNEKSWVGKFVKE